MIFYFCARDKSIIMSKDSLEQQLNFSFAETRNKCPQDNEIKNLSVPSEKRALGMWVATLLQLHSEEFLHALKYCRKLAIGQLNQYMLKHYAHLKVIIRYYIIGLMIDYEVINQQQCELETEDSRQCIFLNIIIQELTNRFFRQSQWLHKINHLPSYIIFSYFDPFFKGYTSVRQITEIAQKSLVNINKKHKIQQKKLKKLVRLLQKKMNNNLKGKDPRILQQNFQELMLRVNLISFEEVFINRSKSQLGSSRYEEINESIKKYEQKKNEQEKIRISDDHVRSRRQNQQLELMIEDFSIKQKSEIMSKKGYSSDIYPETTRKQWSSTGKNDIFISTPSPLSGQKIYNHRDKNSIGPSNDTKYSMKAQTLTDPHTLNTFPLKQRTMNTMNIENHLQAEILFHDAIQVEKNKLKLSFRYQVIQQLSLIKQEKRRNHILYLQYI